MTTLSSLVRVCIWVLGFYKLEVVAKSLCSCLCLLDAMFELCAMDEKMSNDFLVAVGGGCVYSSLNT